MRSSASAGTSNSDTQARQIAIIVRCLRASSADRMRSSGPRSFQGFGGRYGEWHSIRFVNQNVRPVARLGEPVAQDLAGLGAAVIVACAERVERPARPRAELARDHLARSRRRDVAQLVEAGGEAARVRDPDVAADRSRPVPVCAHDLRQEAIRQALDARATPGRRLTGSLAQPNLARERPREHRHVRGHRPARRGVNPRQRLSPRRELRERRRRALGRAVWLERVRPGGVEHHQQHVRAVHGAKDKLKNGAESRLHHARQLPLRLVDRRRAEDARAHRARSNGATRSPHGRPRRTTTCSPASSRTRARRTSSPPSTTRRTSSATATGWASTGSSSSASSRTCGCPRSSRRSATAPTGWSPCRCSTR